MKQSLLSRLTVAKSHCCLADYDQEIVETGDRTFACRRSDEALLEMVDRAEPLCGPESDGYQWLLNDSDIRLLLSRSGQWRPATLRFSILTLLGLVAVAAAGCIAVMGGWVCLHDIRLDAIDGALPSVASLRLCRRLVARYFYWLRQKQEARTATQSR